jgi:hypothetical protein
MALVVENGLLLGAPKSRTGRKKSSSEFWRFGTLRNRKRGER